MENNWQFTHYDTHDNAWRVYRKIENGRGYWKAVKGEAPFCPETARDITYQQALGYEPIEETLSTMLGRILLP